MMLIQSPPKRIYSRSKRLLTEQIIEEEKKMFDIFIRLRINFGTEVKSMQCRFRIFDIL